MGKREWGAVLVAALAGAVIGVAQGAGDWAPWLLTAVATAAILVIGLVWMALGGGKRPPDGA